MLDATWATVPLLPSETGLLSQSGTHTQVRILPCMCTRVRSHTHPYTHVPRLQMQRHALTGALWDTSPRPHSPLVQVPIITCLGPGTVLPPLPGMGLAEGMGRRARSQGRVGLGSSEPTATPPGPAHRPQLERVMGGQGRGTPPSLGQVPHPQLTLWLEASGSPKRGAHGVQSWGGPGWNGPLCASPAPGGWAGQTL